MTRMAAYMAQCTYEKQIQHTQTATKQHQQM